MEAPTALQLNRFAIAIQAGKPVMLDGPPGTAKTALAEAIVRSIASKSDEKWAFVGKIASHLDPSDFGGLPYVGDKYVQMKVYEWAYNLSKEVLGNGRALVFIDEFRYAPKSVQDSILQMIHEGKVGDVQLGPNVSRAAATNSARISSSAPMSPAMVNRFCVLPFTMDAEYWVNAALNGFPDPVVPIVPTFWKDFIPENLAIVASFIQKYTSMAYQEPQSEEQWESPWPSYRSWTNAAELLAAVQSADLGDEIGLGLVSGCVGAGAADSFFNYRRTLDLPKPADLLKVAEKDPSKVAAMLPKRGDQLYATLNSVVSFVIAQGSRTDNIDKLWTAAWVVLGAVPDTKMDVACSCARLLAKARAEQRIKPTTIPKVIAKFYATLNKAGIAHVVQAKAA